MNELTKRMVVQAVKKNRASAKSGRGFEFHVINEHWDYCIDKFGVDIKQGLLDELEETNPEYFEDGLIKDYLPQVYDLDLELSHKTVKLLRQKIAETPALQLDDWGDLPKIVANQSDDIFYLTVDEILDRLGFLASGDMGTVAVVEPEKVKVKQDAVAGVQLGFDL